MLESTETPLCKHISHTKFALKRKSNERGIIDKEKSRCLCGRTKNTSSKRKDSHQAQILKLQNWPHFITTSRSESKAFRLSKFHSEWMSRSNRFLSTSNAYVRLYKVDRSSSFEKNPLSQKRPQRLRTKAFLNSLKTTASKKWKHPPYICINKGMNVVCYVGSLCILAKSLIYWCPRNENDQ